MCSSVEYLCPLITRVQRVVHGLSTWKEVCVYIRGTVLQTQWKVAQIQEPEHRSGGDRVEFRITASFAEPCKYSRPAAILGLAWGLSLAPAIRIFVSFFYFFFLCIFGGKVGSFVFATMVGGLVLFWRESRYVSSNFCVLLFFYFY